MLRSSPLISCLLLSFLLMAGCGGTEPVAQYRVPKTKAASASQDSALPNVAVPEGERAWFLKLTGPVNEVVKHAENFVRLLGSTDLSSGRPRFRLPEGWELTSESGALRFATIKIPGTQPALEVSVTVLPFTPGNSDDYVLANLNRWRGQLGLEPLTSPNWRSDVEQRQELISVDRDEQQLEVVRLLGKTPEYGDSLMLAAMILPARDEPQLPFSFQLPAGWEVGPPRPIRIASFVIGGIDLSVTRFPGGGSPLDNVNRWRGQIQLEPIPEDQLEGAIERRQVGGREAYVTVLSGPEQGILAAGVMDGDNQWFFKAQGPSAEVAAQTENFRKFLDSIEFR